MKYLADLSFREGRLQEARDGYRRAIAAQFRHPDAFVNLAAIAEREGRLDEARTALMDAVQMVQADADAWNRLGLLEARHGAVDAARRAFTSAIAAEPGRAEPYYNLGRSNAAPATNRRRRRVCRKRSCAILRIRKRTTSSEPDICWPAQPEPALEAYRAALAARPDYAEALFGAARAALDLGRSDEARRDYEHFVRVAPPEYRQQMAAAREALRRLECPAPVNNTTLNRRDRRERRDSL